MPENPNWRQMLADLAPVVGALATTGAGSDPAWLEGWQRGSQLAQRERDTRETREQQRSLKAAEFLLDLQTRTAGLTDPVEFQSLVDLGDDIYARAGFGEAGYVKGRLRFSPSKQAEARLTELADRLQQLERAGYDVFQLAESGAQLDLKDGSQVSVAQALDLTRRAPKDASGKAVRPPARPDVNASTDYGRALARYAKSRNKSVTDLTWEEEQQFKRQYEALNDQPRTPPPPRAGADGLFDSLVALWKAGHPRQEPPPSVMVELQRQAIREASAAGRKPEGSPTGELPPPTLRRVNQLADAFRREPVVVRTNTIAEAYSFVNNLSDTTENPADDQALIYAFAKAMDPESVVREGEYATVQKYAQSWLQAFGFNAQRVLSNTEFLTSDARKKLKDTIRQRYAAARGGYDNVRRQYAGLINKETRATDGESYLLDYAAAYPSTAPRGAPPPVPAPPSPNRPQQASTPRPSAPRVGEVRMVGGQRARWDGKGWLPVSGAR